MPLLRKKFVNKNLFFWFWSACFRKFQKGEEKKGKIGRKRWKGKEKRKKRKEDCFLIRCYRRSQTTGRAKRGPRLKWLYFFHVLGAADQKPSDDHGWKWWIFHCMSLSELNGTEYRECVVNRIFFYDCVVKRTLSKKICQVFKFQKNFDF